jgi:hypothetical protein
MKKKKKSFKSIIITAITILLVTNIIISLDHLIDYRKHRPSGKWYWYGYVRWPDFENRTYYFCKRNISHLHGFVEMYNMDHSEMMHELDLERLLEKKYIKSIPTVSYSKCKYISKGDLTDNGEICCELHGSMSEITQKYETEKREFDKKITIYNVSIRLIPAILYFLYALISLAI